MNYAACICSNVFCGPPQNISHFGFEQNLPIYYLCIILIKFNENLLFIVGSSRFPKSRFPEIPLSEIALPTYQYVSTLD